MKRFARTLSIAAVLGIAMSSTAALSATASPGPADGKNIGFRFSGTSDLAPTANAIFLETDGQTLVPCLGDSSGCNFDFRYSIDGTVDQSALIEQSYNAPAGYVTWPEITSENVDASLCEPANFEPTRGPYTNFNCFNDNGFGQAFTPTRSGVLSNFSMATTCLSPTGSMTLTALLYVIDMNGSDPMLAGDPIATAPVSLTGCSTSWSGHEFTDADFQYPVIDFGAVTVDSTTAYGVLFSGDGIAGTPPVGAPEETPTAAPVAALATTGVAGAELLGAATFVGLTGVAFLLLRRRATRA
ncbi:MAG TPA: hypothetical protein VK139_00425 [Microbacteriaceae bacterium]|nr:hypothetical protein [Microbacteriaceae bacterium]